MVKGFPKTFREALAAAEAQAAQEEKDMEDVEQVKRAVESILNQRVDYLVVSVGTRQEDGSVDATTLIEGDNIPDICHLVVNTFDDVAKQFPQEVNAILNTMIIDRITNGLK